MSGGAEPKPRSLARWVEPPPDPRGATEETRFARQWSAIQERRGQKRGWGRRWVTWWAAGGGLVVAAAALAILQPWASDAERGSAVAGAIVSSAPGAVIESGPEPIAVHLADGSQIDLGERTRLEAAAAPGRDVRLELRRGRATFEVARDPGRRFAVVAGSVRVVVVGTRFSVEHQRGGDAREHRVAVRVERGVVEVHTARGMHRLGAGETWSGAADEASDEAGDPVGTVGAPPAEEPSDRGRARSEPPSASALWVEGRDARRDGRDADAARAYEQLLRRHPRDGHAGLAAFELARIRMDVLGQTRDAIEPLQRAIAARVFREDAMARLVRAYDETGQSARCRAARERYAEAYPEGLHRAAVDAACGE